MLDIGRVEHLLHFFEALEVLVAGLGQPGGILGGADGVLSEELLEIGGRAI